MRGKPCGMTYQTFEDLPVWREAIHLAELCEDLLDEVSLQPCLHAPAERQR